MRELSERRGAGQRILRAVGWLILRAGGWKPAGQPPELPKYLVIAAPHTSNWDFPIMLGIAFYFNLRVFWMGKDSVFRGPLRPLFLWLGGIPVDRTKPNGMVEDAVDAFRKHDRLVIAVLPEGTRKRSEYWKSGFYHIAMGAGVPIALGFADYRRKEGGFGPVFIPSGEIDADMAKISRFYENVIGKRPENQTPVRLRPRESQAGITQEGR